jgi:nicotinate phosphoribosyltransferase
MSFPSEFEAFCTYARLYPDNCTLLVDTYDTLHSGVPNAIRTFRQMQEEGIRLKKFGIRLDSGDLAYMSKRARAMLDEAGFTDATITASSDLDEYLIQSLMAQRAAINSWGVGTNLITSKNTPAFGGVYKLAAIEDENGRLIPKIKLSDNTEKITNPGNKKIYRIYDRQFHKIRADLICLEDEEYDPSRDLILFDPKETWKKTKLKGGTYEMRQLLVPVFLGGECVYESPSVMEIRDICTMEKESLWDETKRFVNPHEMYVDLSDRLFQIRSELLEEMSRKQLQDA